jgi:dihydrodipicolinate reductase-like protein/uncharacterized protein DUF1479
VKGLLALGFPKETTMELDVRDQIVAFKRTLAPNRYVLKRAFADVKDHLTRAADSILTETAAGRPVVPELEYRDIRDGKVSESVRQSIRNTGCAVIVIDYAHDDKIDAPSGTARELAARLSRVRPPEFTVPVKQTTGEPAARGATIAGAQVHSIRLPGFVISAEVIFGMPDQRLSIRHDSGSSARPYVDGALLAIRRVWRAPRPGHGSGPVDIGFPST